MGVGPDRYLTELPQRPDLAKYPLNAGVCDTLVRMHEALGVEPMLAERRTYDEVSNTYQFFLRHGVLFHGQELSADDVKFTCDAVSAADSSNFQQLGPDSVRVIDRHTVAVTPRRANRRLAEQIASHLSQSSATRR